jgi:hypothetical protein
MTPDQLITELTELSTSLANEQQWACSSIDHAETREIESYYCGRESAFEDSIDYVNALIEKLKQHLDVPPVA